MTQRPRHPEPQGSASAPEPHRCAWATTALSVRYHDEEWGVPAHAEQILFAFLILEGAQAGLSWETILRKREGYRAAFAQFDPARVAVYDAQDVDRLLADPGIVRNRLKIAAAIRNAQAFLAVQEEFGASTPTSGGSWTVCRGKTRGERPQRCRHGRRNRTR